MSRVITPLFKIMNNAAFMSLINKAHANLLAIAPQHDPFAGHLAYDEPTKSRFLFPSAGIGTIADLLSESTMVSIEEGRGAILLTFEAGHEIGEVVTNSPRPDGIYVMEKVHGMIQPKGEGEIIRGGTKIFTICLTWEDVPDQGKDLALASVYPGRPDSVWDMTDLTEGKIISGQELIDRGCIRVC